MEIFISILLNTLAVLVTSYLLPGVKISGFFAALVVAIVLGVINTFLRPLLIVLTLPINVLTLGLFTFVLNALLVLLVSAIVPAFRVDGFWWALLFSLLLSVVNGFLQYFRT